MAMARLGGVDELAEAMIGQRELQSWSVRAPWAAFGVAPLLILAGAWYCRPVPSVVGMAYLSA